MSLIVPGIVNVQPYLGWDRWQSQYVSRILVVLDQIRCESDHINLYLFFKLNTQIINMY